MARCQREGHTPDEDDEKEGPRWAAQRARAPADYRFRPRQAPDSVSARQALHEWFGVYPGRVARAGRGV